MLNHKWIKALAVSLIVSLIAITAYAIALTVNQVWYW